MEKENTPSEPSPISPTKKGKHRKTTECPGGRAACKRPAGAHINYKQVKANDYKELLTPAKARTCATTGALRTRTYTHAKRILKDAKVSDEARQHTLKAACKIGCD